jgi:hypothetical protein
MKWLALAIGLAVLFAAVACGSSEEGLDDATASPTPQRTQAAGTPAPPPGTSCTIDEPGCGPGLTSSPPPLTADQERAKQIALADPVVVGVLGSATYQVTGVSDFSVRDNVVIGGVITIALDQPLLVDADLPYIDMGYRGDEGNGTPQIQLPPPYYIDGVSHTTQFDTKSLFIDVDLNREKVVSIIAAPF